ncbi:hypothetical protein BH23VER1_BH23VER1_00010 [soil metagenome]
MKLETFLDRRSGFLHVAPIVDVVLLLLIFFLLGSSFTLQSGVAVEVPESGAVLRPMARAHVITLSAGSKPRVYLNETELALGALAPALEELKSKSAHVIIRADRLAAHGLVMDISNIALGQGYEVAYATVPEGGAAP